jgi:hypothetical protein
MREARNAGLSGLGLVAAAALAEATGVSPGQTLQVEASASLGAG